MNPHRLLFCLVMVAICLVVPGCGPASRSVDGVQVVGSGHFCTQVDQALKLLREKDAEAYGVVKGYVGRIEEGARSGMWAERKPPTYEMSGVTAYYSLTWCAATIAHDAFHSRLYHEHLKTKGEPVPRDVWTGSAAEQRCMAFQIGVMQRIGAPTLELEHARSVSDGRYVQDPNSWEEYRKRNW